MGKNKVFTFIFNAFFVFFMRNNNVVLLLQCFYIFDVKSLEGFFARSKVADMFAVLKREVNSLGEIWRVTVYQFVKEKADVS